MDRYAGLADALVQEHGWRIVLMGGNKERQTIEEIVARTSSRIGTVAGILTFRQSAALIARSALVVSGDTGPMHMAAALGTPQIALFGPTSPAWYGPRGGRSLTLARPVPCGPCDKAECPKTGTMHQRCLTEIGVDDVLEAVRTLTRPPAPAHR